MLAANVTRRNFIRGATGGLLAVGLGVGVAGCSSIDLSTAGGGGDLLDQLRDRGNVRMGFANETPFAYIDSEGDLTGQAAEVGKEIFRRLGVDSFVPKLADFSSLIPGLNAGLFDVISAGMYITPARCEQILFTNPDYNAPYAFLVPEGNPLGLTTLEDVVANPDVVLGVIVGGVEESVATGVGVPSDQIVVFPDQVSGIDGVAAGRADAFLLSTLSLRSALGGRPDSGLELSEPPFIPTVDGVDQNGAGGFGFRLGEANIVESFNSELATLKSEGLLLPIVEPFGFTEDEMTDLTAEELCQAPLA
ncbi:MULTISPECIES: ectoine/hydroxyectoine ABC transporter substrate-binding protein EhuB [Actinoalloteichus]|uniref:Amino acid ABC transporter substrate-binding protein n=1 Tax=Actinoalloteichus fjordicus TaxID=1612552 RepID=A0AAC9PQS8_9PSEU|nr:MULTISPECIES: ectoine/hydroxyectoine ABC transporter substrate-binding protein EhuB [Actinoalloteichus]APU13489.1 amino acid ABC transporter substrate-binding protein [Actinoalloteichus fjordicus]APU19438.1 amino acid ABC transporter substrate-binding protein [Actinoalloteichus sp. GBA129-24]